MEKWNHKINAVLEVMWMITLPLVIANGLFYLLGSFIAWDFDPFHWWAFTTTVGRVLMVIVEVAILVNIPTWWDQFDKK
jgi:membrane protein YdbS with pleckstrin-like domain